jgi:hypothetical protein
MRLKKVPSSPTLRQRLNAAASSEKVDCNRISLEESAELLRNVHVPLTGLLAGEERYILLDLDVSTFDNSGAKKGGTVTLPLLLISLKKETVSTLNCEKAANIAKKKRMCSLSKPFNMQGVSQTENCLSGWMQAMPVKSTLSPKAKANLKAKHR